MADVTQMLAAIEEGQPEAAAALLPVLYDELRRLAGQKMAQEKPGQTIQATALVHEAYLRLVGDGEDGRAWQSRGHFFAAAAEAMRRILVEAARRKMRLKRGGKLVREELVEEAIIGPEEHEDLVELDAALEKLATVDPRKAELVKLRYFAGLTSEQAAELLGISATTAERYWSYARAWLYREVQQGAR
jgi:RNA polymerase sigma factor (TIGR02999 family)